MKNERRSHLLKFLEKGLRYDKRKLDEFREITVELGVSKNAEGSARVKLGDTEIIAGIKMSVEKPYPDTPDDGNLMVGAELSPMSSPDFESGPPGTQAVELARVVDRGIRESKAMDTKTLCIEKGERVWTTCIDLVTINADGNLIDAASLAALAALRDTKLPEYDEKEKKLDYKSRTNKKLPLKKTPIAITVYKIGPHYLIDPTAEEEELIDARLTVTTSDGKLCAMQKGENSPLTIEDVDKMVSLAIHKAKELAKRL
ncbi:exosome complex protein Rrp42 [Candidatus Woesearchaeota archaeon]|nr:exosome complex protein Rrp42 [Candidatus Woesearchaeota archaeon]